MKILTRIKDPQELLERRHAQARLVMKKYDQHNHNYEEILESVNVDEKDPLILFTYNDNKNSYTADLSNELLYKHPNKIIVIGRETNGSYKCSLRAANVRIDQILEKILSEIGGEGGGHEHACGAVIESDKFQTFIEMLREAVK
jgi:single-stranded DNA-specific DHH superfamily exonuclease